MSDSELTPEQQRRLDNLRAVASHLQEHPDQASKPAPSKLTATLKRWGPLGVTLLFVFGKLKWVLAALKFAKFGSFLSMLLAVWVYAIFFGWKFSVGFVLLIFVHEMGHALAMRTQGIPFGAPVFIPFVGAVIAMRGRPRDAYVEAIVGIGGPVLGSVGALACFAVALITGSTFWYALASTGFLINLFNLIPISPLDGGRITGVISRWLWVVGYAIGVTVFLFTFSPILFLILLVGLFSLPRLLKGQPEGYYTVPSRQRVGMSLAYFGLIGALSLGMWVTEDPLEAIQQGQQTALLLGAALAGFGALRGR